MDDVCIIGSGSKVDCGSKYSLSGKNVKTALHLADLKQKQNEIDNELRLAAVTNEVEMAELQEGSNSEDRALYDEVETDMNWYLNGCQGQAICKETNPIPAIANHKARCE